MQIYEKFANCPLVGNLNQKVLSYLAQDNIPSEIRDEIVEQSSQGVTFTEKQVREMVAEHKRTANEYVSLSRICHEYHEEFGYQEYERWVKDDLGLGKTRGTQLLNIYERFGLSSLSELNIQSTIICLLSSPSVPESARTEAYVE